MNLENMARSKQLDKSVVTERLHNICDSESQYRCLTESQVTLGDTIKEDSHVKKDCAYQKKLENFTFAEYEMLFGHLSQRDNLQANQLRSRLEQTYGSLQNFKSGELKQFKMEFEKFARANNTVRLIGGDNRANNDAVPVAFARQQEVLYAKLANVYGLMEELQIKLLLMKIEFQASFGSDTLPSGAEELLFSKMDLVVSKIDILAKSQMRRIYESLRLQRVDVR